MPKCWNCNNEDKHLSVGSASGLCINCLEQALDAYIEIMNMLKKDGDDRKKALNAIDNSTAEYVAQQASEDLSKSPFGIWGISTHSNAEQLKRMRRSQSVKIIKFNTETQTALVQGSSNDIYTTTFTNCTCQDYLTRNLPCKHMYKLASQFGNVNFLKFLDPEDNMQFNGKQISIKENESYADTIIGKIFVLAGDPVNFTRIELKKIIDDNMGRVSSSVSKKTDYLIVCDNTSNKIAKAKELGVKTITEDEFLKMLG